MKPSIIELTSQKVLFLKSGSRNNRVIISLNPLIFFCVYLMGGGGVKIVDRKYIIAVLKGIYNIGMLVLQYNMVHPSNNNTLKIHIHTPLVNLFAKASLFGSFLCSYS